MSKEKRLQDRINKVRCDSFAIANMRKPPIEVQMASVIANIYSFNFIKMPAPKVKEYVLSKNPTLIKNIINPTEEDMMVAVQADYNMIYYISEPTDKVIKKAIDINQSSFHLISNEFITDDIKLYYVKKHPKSLWHKVICDKVIHWYLYEYDTNIENNLDNTTKRIIWRHLVLNEYDDKELTYFKLKFGDINVL